MRLKALEQSIKFNDIFKTFGTDFSILIKHPLPEEFIDTYFYRLKPFNLEVNQVLTPYLIIKYQNNLNWKLMSSTQTLTEKMIEEHANYVSWKSISLKQKLSYKFIKKWSKYLQWEYLIYNKSLDITKLLKLKKYFD